MLRGKDTRSSQFKVTKLCLVLELRKLYWGSSVQNVKLYGGRLNIIFRLTFAED